MRAAGHAFAPRILPYDGKVLPHDGKSLP